MPVLMAVGRRESEHLCSAMNSWVN